MKAEQYWQQRGCKMREKVKKIRGTINESNIWMFAERNNRENRRYKVFKEISQNWRVELGRAVEDRGGVGRWGVWQAGQGWSRGDRNLGRPQKVEFKIKKSTEWLLRDWKKKTPQIYTNANHLEIWKKLPISAFYEK